VQPPGNIVPLPEILCFSIRHQVWGVHPLGATAIRRASSCHCEGAGPKQSQSLRETRLLRRFTPRNDGVTESNEDFGAWYMRSIASPSLFTRANLIGNSADADHRQDPRRGTITVAVGETHGNVIGCSSKSTLKGSNSIRGKADNCLDRQLPARGFAPTATIVFPLRGKAPRETTVSKNPGCSRR